MNRLPPEPRLDRHDQQERRQLDGLGGVKRCGRVENQAEPEIELSRLLRHPGRVGHDLDVDGDKVRSRRSELLQMSLWVGDHEMAVEQELGGLAQRSDHRHPEGEVGDEVPVHHVDVEQVHHRLHFGHGFSSLEKSAARIDGAILITV